MILTLNHNTEIRLLAVAAQRGLSPEDTLNAILLEAENEFHVTVGDVQASCKDFAQSRSLLLEEYCDQALKRSQARSVPSRDIQD